MRAGGQQRTQQTARKSGLGAGQRPVHAKQQRSAAHTGVESLKASDLLDPLMWAVTCELRQPDPISALPGSGRPAEADFPSETLWAGAHGSPSQAPWGQPTGRRGAERSPAAPCVPPFHRRPFGFWVEGNPGNFLTARVSRHCPRSPQASVETHRGLVRLFRLRSWAVCFAHYTLETFRF